MDLMSTSPGLVFELMHDLDLMVLCEGTNTPTDADCEAYVNALESSSAERPLRILVVTDGGTPTRSQQPGLLAFHRRRLPKCAVVTSATNIRFVASIFTLANPNVRMFLPSQRDSAHMHLGLKPADADAVWAVVDRLHDKLYVPAPLVAPEGILPLKGDQEGGEARVARLASPAAVRNHHRAKAAKRN
jgi:hypothetical protein